MIPAPQSTEIDGFKRLVKFMEPKNCRDVTGEPCGTVLSDECAACIEIEAAIVWLREAVERGGET